MVYDKVIEGKTVRLRAVAESDAEVTYKMRTDPEKTRYIHASNGTVEDQLNYIKRQREKPGDYLFLVEDRSGNAIGMKGIYEHDPVANTVESGRFIGYGTQVQNIEAMVLSLDFAFDILGVDVVKMGVMENNTGMVSIQKKFGVEFTHREEVPGMEGYNLVSVLPKEKYAQTRPGIEALINRFANRN